LSLSTALVQLVNYSKHQRPRIVFGHFYPVFFYPVFTAETQPYAAHLYYYSLLFPNLLRPVSPSTSASRSTSSSGTVLTSPSSLMAKTRSHFCLRRLTTSSSRDVVPLCLET